VCICIDKGGLSIVSCIFKSLGFPMKYFLLFTLIMSSSAFSNEVDETMRLAIQGDANAQFKLGQIYDKVDECELGISDKYQICIDIENSYGVTEDDAVAFKWYAKAAEMRHVKAQLYLAAMYEKGYGIPENDALAVKWYRKAAKQGDVKAQNNLSVMYENSEGVSKDLVRAYVWKSMAKTQGYEDAKENIEITKSKMTSKQIAQAQELALKCWESEFKDCD